MLFGVIGKSQPLSQSAVAKAGILSLAGKFGSVPSAAKNEKKVDDVSKKQPVQKKKETTKEKPKEITNLDEAVAEVCHKKFFFLFEKFYNLCELN